MGFLLWGQGTLRNNVFRDVLAIDNMGVGFSAMRPYTAGAVSGNSLERAKLTGNGAGATGDLGGSAPRLVTGWVIFSTR